MTVRRFILAALVSLHGLLAATGAAAAAPAAPALSPADCSAGVTPEQTEGPYFKPGSPERASLVDAGTAGTRVTLTGWVVTKGCRPVPGAVLDFWQANDAGQYDNSGYGMRGHVIADAQGRYTIETILPGNYTGRTRHIHVKVQAPGKAAMTTQLYFPEDSQGNKSDRIYNARLLVTWLAATTPRVARYDFVLG